MRKIVCIILALLLLCLTACGGDAASEQTTPTPPLETVTPDCAEPTPTATATPEPTPAWSQEPETMTVVLEGMEETVSGYRYTSALGYSMVYDPDYVRPEPHEGYDDYTVVTGLDATEAYMRVTKDNRSMEQVRSELEANGAVKNGDSYLGGCYGIILAKYTGYTDSDVVTLYHLAQAGDAVYIAEYSYLWEFAEGLGLRMYHMLSTIRFADAPPATEMQIMFQGEAVKDFTASIGELFYLSLRPNEGAYLESAEWMMDNDGVCVVYYDYTGGYIEIVGEGTSKLTVKCGDLEQTVNVHGIKSW